MNFSKMMYQLSKTIYYTPKGPSWPIWLLMTPIPNSHFVKLDTTSTLKTKSGRYFLPWNPLITHYCSQPLLDPSKTYQFHSEDQSSLLVSLSSTFSCLFFIWNKHIFCVFWNSDFETGQFITSVLLTSQ